MFKLPAKLGAIKINTMKKLTFYLALLFVVSLFSNCQKEDLTGDLIVNARDISGASIIGETVYLYANEADFNNLLYTTTETTDNSGQVRFIDLEPGVYYVDCDFANAGGGTTNIWGSGSVSAGYETTITINP